MLCKHWLLAAQCANVKKWNFTFNMLVSLLPLGLLWERLTSSMSESLYQMKLIVLTLMTCFVACQIWVLSQSGCKYIVPHYVKSESFWWWNKAVFADAVLHEHWCCCGRESNIQECDCYISERAWEIGSRCSISYCTSHFEKYWIANGKYKMVSMQKNSFCRENVLWR